MFGERANGACQISRVGIQSRYAVRAAMAPFYVTLPQRGGNVIDGVVRNYSQALVFQRIHTIAENIPLEVRMSEPYARWVV